MNTTISQMSKENITDLHSRSFFSTLNSIGISYLIMKSDLSMCCFDTGRRRRRRVTCSQEFFLSTCLSSTEKIIEEKFGPTSDVGEMDDD